MTDREFRKEFVEALNKTMKQKEKNNK